MERLLQEAAHYVALSVQAAALLVIAMTFKGPGSKYFSQSQRSLPVDCFPGDIRFRRCSSPRLRLAPVPCHPRDLGIEALIA